VGALREWRGSHAPNGGRVVTEVAWGDRSVSVEVLGALDFVTAGDVRQRLLDILDREPRRVTVDVSRAFVDSSGVGMLLGIAQRVRLDKGAFRLVCDQHLSEVVDRLGLVEIFGLVTSRANSKVA
jgi:anti-anti-sigma factor